MYPFYTLGTASYLDSSEGDDSEYRKLAQQSNPILLEHFSSLYDRLKHALEEATGAPVIYEKELALPGFHIFLSDKMFEKPIASVHFDLQFESIQWDYEDVDYDNLISFTLPITLPHTGGGLYYWDIFRPDVKDLLRRELDALKETKERKYHPYEVGNLVVHNGLMLHQIAPGKDLAPDDSRITLQGHGLFCDGAYRLYW